MDQDEGRDAVPGVLFVISNATQFREAVSRLRFLENVRKDSPLGRERDAVELAVSRYLACSERPPG